MIEEIDLHLFLEIISTEGCIPRWQEEIDGEIIYHYLSKNGNTREQIFGGDETLDRLVVEKHLEKLELSYLIPVMSYTTVDINPEKELDEKVEEKINPAK